MFIAIENSSYYFYPAAEALDKSCRNSPRDYLKAFAKEILKFKTFADLKKNVNAIGDCILQLENNRLQTPELRKIYRIVRVHFLKEETRILFRGASGTFFPCSNPLSISFRDLLYKNSQIDPEDSIYDLGFFYNSVIQIMIDYFHVSNLEGINQSSLKRILERMDDLLISELEEIRNKKLVDFLIANLNPRSVWGWVEWAEKYQKTYIRMLCVDYLKFGREREISWVSDRECWGAITQNILKMLRSYEFKYLKSGFTELSVTSYIEDKETFKAMVRFLMVRSLNVKKAIFHFDNNTYEDSPKDLHYINDENVIPVIAELLRDNNNITHLTIFFMYISPAYAQALVDALKTNENLIKLDLSSCFTNQPHRKLRCLGRALKVNCSITKLNLEGKAIKVVGGVESLSRCLEKNSTIKKLGLRYNVLKSPNKLERIWTAINQSSSITKLNLSNNYINIAGAEVIAGFLRGNNSITDLNLEHNKVYNNGARALVESIKARQYTIRLNLKVNRIDKSHKAELLAEMIGFSDCKLIA